MKPILGKTRDQSRPLSNVGFMTTKKNQGFYFGQILKFS